MLIRVDVNHPPLLIYLDNPADNYIADIRPVTLPERPNANNLIDLMHDSSHACVDLVVFLILVSAVTSYKSLTNMVTW
jgi:hypothetical protein